MDWWEQFLVVSYVSYTRNWYKQNRCILDWSAPGCCLTSELIGSTAVDVSGLRAAPAWPCQSSRVAIGFLGEKSTFFLFLLDDCWKCLNYQVVMKRCYEQQCFPWCSQFFHSLVILAHHQSHFHWFPWCGFWQPWNLWRAEYYVDGEKPGPLKEPEQKARFRPFHWETFYTFLPVRLAKSFMKCFWFGIRDKLVSRSSWDWKPNNLLCFCRASQRVGLCQAENKPGHRPINSYQLPKWVYHPERVNRRSSKVSFLAFVFVFVYWFIGLADWFVLLQFLGLSFQEFCQDCDQQGGLFWNGGRWSSKLWPLECGSCGWAAQDDVPISSSNRFSPNQIGSKATNTRKWRTHYHNTTSFNRLRMIFERPWSLTA